MGPSERQIRDVLRNVLDPELGINIVDLGLLRRVTVDGSGVRISLVMTSPACPLGETLIRDIRSVLRQHDMPQPTELTIVREPPWSPDCMTAEGKRQLGWPDSRHPG